MSYVSLTTWGPVQDSDIAKTLIKVDKGRRDGGKHTAESLMKKGIFESISSFWGICFLLLAATITKQWAVLPAKKDTFFLKGRYYIKKASDTLDESHDC